MATLSGCTLRDLVFRLNNAAEESETTGNGITASACNVAEKSCGSKVGAETTAADGQLAMRSRRLTAADREAVIDMISYGFAGKGDLETALGDVTYDVMRANVEAMWPTVLAADLSIVVHEVMTEDGRDEGRLVGACISTDVRAAHHRQGYGSFNRVLAFLAAVERPHLDGVIPKEEGCFYSSMLGTAKHLRYQEFVLLSMNANTACDTVKLD
jgi:hypothetical protein